MSTTDNTPSTPGPTPEDDTVRAVWGLAREVEGLRNQFADEVAALRKTVTPLEAMPEKLRQLARTVQALAEQLAIAEPDEPSWSWLDLPPELDRAQELLTDLTVWLRQIFLRYTDAAAALPECWMWHPDVVEELVWLMVAWEAAYRDGDATVARAADWHDRYRPGVVKRIKAAAGTCSLENHQPDAPAHRPAPTVPLGEAVASIVAWWGGDRDQAAPTPTDEQLTAAQAMTGSRRSGGGRR